MFVTVEYGDGKLLLVNPDCTAIVLQDYVRRACDIQSSVTVDFSDEHASLMELFNKSPQENMFDYFMPRSTFVLVQVDRGTDGSIVKLTPLLTDWEKKYPFMERKLRQRDKKNKQALAAVEKDGGKERGRGSKLSIKSESPTTQVPSKVNLKIGKNSAKGDNRTTSTTPSDDTPSSKKSTGKVKKKHVH